MSRARAVGRAVLVSIAEPVEPIDLIGVASCGPAPTMYWAAPREGVEIAARGQALAIGGNGEYRYADVGNAWSRLMADAVVHDERPDFPASGPILTGGFSFDPEGARTAAWDGFPAAGFVVPAIAVVRRGDEHRLTLQAMVEEDSDVSELAGELAALRASVLASRVPESRAPRASPAIALVRDDAVETRWKATVQRAVATIRDGRMAKVVLAREVSVPLPVPPAFDAGTALRHLRRTQPDAFVFAIWRDNALFLGATPERLVCLEDGDVETSVLAGSALRGNTPAGDAARSQALRESAKDREEHEIVRRDIHDRLRAVCEGITSPTTPSLVTLPNVHHLHTAVRARLRPGHTVFDVIERLHPTPALGGAPRAAALAFLRDHEGLDRGWYAAPIGWAAEGHAEFAVALRSALVRDGEARLFAGCGIVADSDPEAEFTESVVKLQTALGALVAGSAGPGT